MNDPTTTVHIIKPKKDLFSNLADKVLGYALSLMAFDQAEKVFTERSESVV